MRGRYINQRMAVVPMEPNGCVAVPEPDGRLTFYASTQMPHGLADQLAGALAIERDAVRVVTPQVGGGFGGKAGICPEYSAVAGAARSLGRPVTWVPTRSEDLVSLPHSRAQVQHAELAVDADGRFRALRVRLLGDAGAYPSIGAYLPGLTKRMSNGVYEIDAIQFDVAVAVTNTTPTGAYRGAGRPEATALLERLVGQAALELDIDPIELRRRNLIARTAFPFTAHSGAVYDSGDYVLPLDVAADAVGYGAFREEQARRRAAGDRVQLGIGVATYVEITAGGDDGEFGALEVHEDGSATVRAGTLSHGQGHQTAYAMLVQDRTGIPVERITLVDGDTDLVPRGGGTGGSRSLQIGGSAVDRAAVSLVERARHLAASMLEADPADVVVDTSRGTIGVAGVPASALTWAELATRAAALPEPETLSAEEVFRQDGATFPFGAHIAVVEVDLDTGAVRLLRHVAVDDCGTVVNPLLVEGQQHGGVAAGIGQALFEEVRYDATGNPVTATLVDYGIPTAAELPSFEVLSTHTPTPLNPLGAKGIGEAATIGSTPAVQNAVVDALAHLGVRHVDLPCSPQRVWETIRAAEAGALPDPWREPPPVFDALRAARSDARTPTSPASTTPPGSDADGGRSGDSGHEGEGADGERRRGARHAGGPQRRRPRGAAHRRRLRGGRSRGDRRRHDQRRRHVGGDGRRLRRPDRHDGRHRVRPARPDTRRHASGDRARGARPGRGDAPRQPVGTAVTRDRRRARAGADLQHPRLAHGLRRATRRDPRRAPPRPTAAARRAGRPLIAAPPMSWSRAR